MFKGLGGLGDMAGMMKKAQEMQEKMAQMQEGLDELYVSGEAGAGLVKATCSAKGDLHAIDIDPSIFSESDKEMVEDLIVTAIKAAQAAAAQKAQEQMQELTQSLGLPAGFKMPGMD